MRVFPSPGLLVRDPVKRDALPVEGRDVPDGDFYWLKRLAVGDATTTKPVAASEAASAVVTESKSADLPTASAPVNADLKASKSTPSDGSDGQ